LHYLGAAHGGDRSDPRFDFGSLAANEKEGASRSGFWSSADFLKAASARSARSWPAKSGWGTAYSEKAAELIEVDAPISVAQPPQFASRGALKLGGALDFFGVDVQGKTALDIGASTGGFTDCLLQRGAAKVFAIERWSRSMAWKIEETIRVWW